MENIYLGREPVSDSDSNLCAYEILYKDRSDGSKEDVSASVVNIILNKFATASLLGSRRAFVKVDEAFLLDDKIFSIPSEFFILSVMDGIVLSDEIIARLRELKSKEYQLSLDANILSIDVFNRYKSVMKLFSYVKIDVEGSSKKVVDALKKANIKIVATKIDNSEQYDTAKELGCEWFQGYFFAEVKLSKDKKYKPAHAKILKLYNLLMQDVSIGEITAEFENAHEISMSLLKFINSGAFHFRSRISSIHHILTLVGRKPLGQWLMLMIYSKSVTKGGGVSPLMLMVKNRIELMERILKAIQNDANKDMIGEAYFVGVLSLIDVVFNVELEKILKDINTSDGVENALLKDEGILGEIYQLVKAIENSDTQGIRIFQKKYDLSSEIIENIVIQSMEDVNEFENPSEKP